MLRIIICDDDRFFLKRQRDKIRVLLQEMDIAASIAIYACAEDLSKDALSKCDIAFLDVDFGGKQYSGIDIARSIRKYQTNAVIIFVSNYVEFAPEGYEVQALHYLLKDKIPQKLKQCLTDAIERFNAMGKTFRINSCGEKVDVPLIDILYIESYDHALLVHTQKKGDPQSSKSHTCYDTLTAMEAALAQDGFLRIQRSYLVNMRRITQFHSKGIVLDNNERLKPSENNYAQLKKEYLAWKGME